MIPTTIRVNPSASWLPPSFRRQVRDAGGSISVNTGFSRSEKKIMRKRKPMFPSSWAQRHRVLTMSSLPGAWRNSVTPYLVGVMDTFAFPSVREMVDQKAPQTGVSEAAHNCVGWCVDRYPGPVMYCYPDERTTRENSQDRVNPMIKSSARLRGYLTGVQDDDATLRINLKHMPIYFSWASSPSRLGNKPIKIVIADEVNKYPPTAGTKEAPPLKLLDKRLNTYRRVSKFWKISTPTTETGNITVELETCQVVFQFWVECPDCGHLQLMSYKGIRVSGFGEKLPEIPYQDKDSLKDIEAERKAFYECERCKSLWNDAARNKAVSLGEWYSDGEDSMPMMKYLDKYRPIKIGRILPSYISPFVSLSEIAVAYLESKKPDGSFDRNIRKDFKNNYEAKPWKHYEVERPEAQIYALCDERPEGLVPGGGIVAGLTAGVDTQDNGFWYCIRAWGYGLMQDSWAVRLGFVTSFEALAHVLWGQQHKDVDGNAYPVQFTLIDSQGHRTKEVYDFCLQYRGGILPTKGEQRLATPFTYTQLENYPGVNKKIPGGLLLCRVNTTFWKNNLSSKLQVAFGDPGSFRYHGELIETRPDWATHMTAEYEDENGVWQCPDNKENHGWDCEVLNLVAADIIGMKHWAPQQETIAHRPRIKVAKSEFMS